MNGLKKHLLKEFKDEILTVNDKKYVPLELFEKSLYNIALDEAVIGTLAYKFGNIELKHSDIIKYMTEYTNNVEVKMTDDRYIAKRI